MKKRLVVSCLSVFCVAILHAQSFSIVVDNPSKTDKKDAPVVLKLKDYTSNRVRSAVVTCNGKEIPSQLDDLNHDGVNDELCFLVDLKKKDLQTYNITLSDQGRQKRYPSRVYVDMMISNKKIKESNKQNLYISQLTVENGTNVYSMLHHHGAAFESELVAYRIYFDHRQTVDIYGKYRKGLELKETQFYPDNTQKANGYGDDVLWVGETLGLGSFRGWNGDSPTLLTDVDHRSQRIIANGPLRTIVEVVDEGWAVNSPKAFEGKDDDRITVKALYTLYAGHRDCSVDITFCGEQPEQKFSTGLINVKNSTEYSDKKGLRGCWGIDWPVSEKDSAGHKRETVGLGICIPQKYIVSEQPANKNNYAYVISPKDHFLHYDIIFASDNESFGYHSDKEWYNFLKEWKKELAQPVVIKKKD